MGEVTGVSSSRTCSGIHLSASDEQAARAVSPAVPWTPERVRGDGLGLGRVLRFAGYAAVFDRPDRGGDVVRRGAFAGAGCVPLLWQHGGAPVGVVEAVAEDARGLCVVARVERAELAEMIASGALTGLSFGYRARVVMHGTYRELIRVDLNEISLVAQPMQRLARVTDIEWVKEEL